MGKFRRPPLSYSSLGNFDLLYQRRDQEKKKRVCGCHRSMFALRAVAYASRRWYKSLGKILPFCSPQVSEVLWDSLQPVSSAIHPSPVYALGPGFPYERSGRIVSFSKLLAEIPWKAAPHAELWWENDSSKWRSSVRPAAVESFLKIKWTKFRFGDSP